MPGSKPQLFLPDQIFTHFEKEEDLATLRGKLEDEAGQDSPLRTGNEQQHRHHE